MSDTFGSLETVVDDEAWERFMQATDYACLDDALAVLKKKKGVYRDVVHLPVDGEAVRVGYSSTREEIRAHTAGIALFKDDNGVIMVGVKGLATNRGNEVKPVRLDFVDGPDIMAVDGGSLDGFLAILHPDGAEELFGVREEQLVALEDMTLQQVNAFVDGCLRPIEARSKT